MDEEIANKGSENASRAGSLTEKDVEVGAAHMESAYKGL